MANIFSVATIRHPEFVNITPYNPLISQCEIKVLYVGENRNKTVISKEVAREMANSLPGCPIVGYFKKENEDFSDHGDRITIEGGKVKVESLTKPYGFVAPDAKVWFQEFEDTDEFGNKILREYLMTTGYLWTGQYEECQAVVDEGKPHSMEIDKDTLKGQWSKNQKTGVDFFIINDAIFSKLCILGDEVEPCFEGASVTAPDISTSFAKIDENDDFNKTLYNMMQELKFALEGGQRMAVEKLEKENLEFSAEQDKVDENISLENQNSTETSTETSFAKKEDEEEDKETSDASAKDESSEEDEDKKDKYIKEEDEDEKEDKEDNSEDSEDKNDEEDSKKKYSLLEEEFSALQEKYSRLENDYNELVLFKNEIENSKKDELIKSFYMLSEEDKADVIANKTQYSLDEIEAKLSVICVRKKVSFTREEPEVETTLPEDRDVITTFNLNESASGIPNWIKAVQKTAQNRH